MVDRLRRSLEQLEPPTCPTCEVEMTWTRSELTAYEPVMIHHTFYCPRCNRTEAVTSLSKPVSITPENTPRARPDAHSAEPTHSD
jgi:hypothetical protein